MPRLVAEPARSVYDLDCHGRHDRSTIQSPLSTRMRLPAINWSTNIVWLPERLNRCGPSNRLKRPARTEPVPTPMIPAHPALSTASLITLSRSPIWAAR